MSQETKLYRVTASAGPYVAGRITPTKTVEVERDGKPVPAIVPDNSVVFPLTEEQARYELLNRTIEVVPEEPPKVKKG